MKYFVYVRKSTDEDDRQVLSIEAQITDLKEFAAKEKLEIVAVFEESKTAKCPGRAIFNDMIKRIENGEAQGVIAWHPDRPARNPIDGGKIIYLIDAGKVHSLKFPTFWFESTPQGKFMLNIAFGQSKYFIDNLSENVKRGLRQKLRRGEWIGWAPVGYLNDLKTHAILVDPEKAPFIKKAFELYASGDYNFSSLKKYLEKAGLRSNYGGVLAISSIEYMLSNPFYYGVIRVKDELYIGAHKPIISKKFFDEVQEMLKKKGRGHEQKVHNYAFTGFIQCVCGCMVTAEVQKGHNYYRCTKKKGKCDEKYVREEVLFTQFLETAQKVSLPDDWAEKMLEKIEEEKQIAAQSSGAFVQNLQEQAQEIDKKLNKLLDAHLEGTIEADEYKSKKTELINARIDLQQKITDFERKGNDWLEPCRQFILDSVEAKKIAQRGDKEEIKIFIKKIGSNFILKGRAVQWRAKRGWRATMDLQKFSTWLPRLVVIRTWFQGDGRVVKKFFGQYIIPPTFFTYGAK